MDRGIIGEKDGRILLRQAKRDEKTGKRKISFTEGVSDKLLGSTPSGGRGKLQSQKAVRVIDDNFGVAILDHISSPSGKFILIPWHKVWARIHKGLNGEPSLIERNGGKFPTIIRKGDLISIGPEEERSIFRIFGFGERKRDGIYFDFNTADSIERRQTSLSATQMVKGKFQILKTSLTGKAQ